MKTEKPAPIEYMEVFRLPDGGFVAAKRTIGEERAQPDFACSTMVEMTDYIARTLDWDGYAERRGRTVSEPLTNAPGIDAGPLGAAPTRVKA